MRKNMAINLLSVSMILTGCSTNRNTGQHWWYTNQTAWVPNQTVSPAQLPSVVVSMVDMESSRFGVRSPKISSAVTDVNDADQKPMYRIKVKGHFVSNGVTTDEIEMLVLANGSVGSVITGNKAFDQEFTMTKVIGEDTPR